MLVNETPSTVMVSLTTFNLFLQASSSSEDVGGYQMRRRANGDVSTDDFYAYVDDAVDSDEGLPLSVVICLVFLGIISILLVYSITQIISQEKADETGVIGAVTKPKPTLSKMTSLKAATPLRKQIEEERQWKLRVAADACTQDSSLAYSPIPVSAQYHGRYEEGKMYREVILNLRFRQVIGGFEVGGTGCDVDGPSRITEGFMDCCGKTYWVERTSGKDVVALVAGQLNMDTYGFVGKVSRSTNHTGFYSLKPSETLRSNNSDVSLSFS